jgi:hypothetical protein
MAYGRRPPMGAVALFQLERLTEDDQRELEDLLSSNNCAMLLRSEALRLLKHRGYDIEAYLKHGA